MMYNALQNIDTTVDGHVHTRLCHHAVGEMEEYVRAGLAKRLKKIVFLEHLEVGVQYFESTWLGIEEFEYYFAEGKRLQNKYHGKIAIGMGVEVGYNPARQEEIKDFLRRYTWESIGISYHFLEVNGRFGNMVSRKKSNIDLLDDYGVDKVIEQYYSGLIEAVRDLPGTVLCHLDAVLRHHPQISRYDNRADLIITLLDSLVEQKMALEVNTSGFGVRKEPFPAHRWLMEARKRNIQLVAGSDAHRPEDVGRHFEQLASYTH